ncbi:Nanos-like protein, partial [Stegodyphus mimosarum]
MNMEQEKCNKASPCMQELSTISKPDMFCRYQNRDVNFFSNNNDSYPFIERSAVIPKDYRFFRSPEWKFPSSSYYEPYYETELSRNLMLASISQSCSSCPLGFKGGNVVSSDTLNNEIPADSQCVKSSSDNRPVLCWKQHDKDISASEEITLSVSKDSEYTTAENGNNQHYAFSHHTSSAAKKICKFCRQNGERKQFYESHQLKDKFGNVECPVLREYVCDICGKTGSEAHTRSYCPVLRKPGGSKFPIALKLKHTLHDSCGRIRK